MCLLSITNIPNKSVKAITCYKIVYHYFNIYSGIWTGFEYGVNNLENKLLVDINPIEPIETAGGLYNISKGYFHAYSNLDHVRKLTSTWLAGRELWKCEIPPLTDYFRDITRYELCAKSIKFIKRIK